MSKTNVTTNIAGSHIEAFQAIGNAKNIALFSCFVNGEPASAIVAINYGDDGMKIITPLFVSITPGMKLVDHDGTPC
jgi:hypothetical protein